MPKVEPKKRKPPPRWKGLKWAMTNCMILPEPFGLFPCDLEADYVCVKCGYVWMCTNHSRQHMKNHKA